jgi:hypothetical protein
MQALRLVDKPIDHALYKKAKSRFGRLVFNAPPGTNVALIGATQSGKTLVLDELFDELLDSINEAVLGAIPYMKLRVQPTRDGRTTLRWMALQFLKILDHPMYRHIGSLDEFSHYVPSGALNENKMRDSLELALKVRGVLKTFLDEAHLLLKTANEKYRTELLESLKTALGIERSLGLCGGYELAYAGLFDSAHFAGRTVVHDFGYYRPNVDADRFEWRRILKSFASSLSLERETLLDEYAVELMIGAHGVIGLVDKWLWTAKQIADDDGCAINAEILRASSPTIAEQITIAADIKDGQYALRRSGLLNVPLGEAESKKAAKVTDDTNRKSKKGRPFERKPKRIQMNGFELIEHA